MDALTLDQIQILLAIAEEGSFSGAARRLRRAQSAVTYGIQKLEEQVGTTLFDRSTYRPALTEAGRALLPFARRIAEETAAFRDKARSLAEGIEPELRLAVDSLFPMPRLVEALRAFAGRFPNVQPRVEVQSLGAAVELVLDGSCAIGLLPMALGDLPELKLFPLLAVRFVPVVAADHLLAGHEGPIDNEVMRRQVQLVLTDRSTLTEGRDYGVLSARTWRLADIGTKHTMLLAGIGWGMMPEHLVAQDLREGRLKMIRPAEFDHRGGTLAMGAAHLGNRLLRPAARWMMDHLIATMAGPGAPQAPSDI